MKSIKRVQIVITDDYKDEKSRDHQILFEVYKSIKRAIEFLNELGISVKQESLYHLWRLPEISKDAFSFAVDPEYHEKLMKLCPIHKKVPLDDALDRETAHIRILPMMD